MLSNFQDMIVGKLVQTLNSHGVIVDIDTLKMAVSHSPQIVQQIQSILLSSTSDEKFPQIVALINQAAGTSGTTVLSSSKAEIKTTF